MFKKQTCVVFFVFGLGLILATVGSAADPSLIGWWQLDETSGTVAHDASGKGHDGTLHGGPTWTVGKVGGALQFDGADDYVEIGSVGIDMTDRRTLTGWAKASTVEIAAETGVFGFIPDITIDGTYFGVEVDADGNYIVNVQGLDGIVFCAVDTQWHHFGLTYNGEGGSWYLDGQLVDSLEGELGTFDQVRLGARLSSGRFFPGQVDDVRVYNRVLTQAEIQAVISGADLGLATVPTPSDGAAEVLCDVVLGWTQHESASRHNVYFGTDRDEVSSASTTNPGDVLVSQGQTGATFDPEGSLDFSQTYYWRVDGIGAGNAILKGRVWRFSTESFASPIEAISASSNATSNAGEGPERTVDGSGLNADDQHSMDAPDMWLGLADGDDPVWVLYAFDRVYKLDEMQVWNYNVEFEPLLGIGLKNVTVEYSVDGTDWTTLGDVELAQATVSADYACNSTVDFDGVAARYVRLNVNCCYGTTPQCGLSEVRFLYVPAHARDPQPADGAVEVDIQTALNWRAGREAAVHEVYFDSDEQAVASGTALVDTVGESTCAIGDLEFGSVYYWRVDEVNEAEPVGSWEGDLWSFTVQDYATIDDFESYTDEQGCCIYETWLDGWVNDTGSMVGYMEAPFAERTVVHGGRQAMPLSYDNTGSAAFSEALRVLSPAWDLTIGGANSLRLYFQGDATNTPAPFYLALEDAAGKVAVATHSDADAALAANWEEWTIPYSDLAGVNLAAIKTVYLGLGDRDNPTSGGEGVLYIDDIGFGHAEGLRR